jgi:hypothetical protein
MFCHLLPRNPVNLSWPSEAEPADPTKKLGFALDQRSAKW